MWQYAAAVINDQRGNKCCAGGPDVAARVAELTGKTAGDSDPMVAFRRCVKVEGNVVKKFEYFGIKSCSAAKMVQDGPDTSTHVSDSGIASAPAHLTPCGSKVIWSISLRKNAPVVEPVYVCPNSILELIPRRSRVMVFCSSQDKGKAVKDVCDAGCISCGACIKKCPAQCISMVDERIVIDHKVCLAYGPSCEEVCALNVHGISCAA